MKLSSVLIIILVLNYLINITAVIVSMEMTLPLVQMVKIVITTSKKPTEWYWSKEQKVLVLLI